jgi:exopolyphosphatase/pppGpp-phosphohydrolase
LPNKLVKLGYLNFFINPTQINSSFEERNAHPHIIEIRKRLAPVAAVKTGWILEKIKTTKIIFSPCSLKEGVLLS